MIDEWPESWKQMLNEQTEEEKKRVVELRLDKQEDWDKAEMKMVLKFYELIGLDVRTEVEFADFGRMGF